MKHRTLHALAVALALAAAPAGVLAQGEPIKLVNLLELSGPIASAGINYRDGVELAVKEINAAGGVLGRKFGFPVRWWSARPTRAARRSPISPAPRRRRSRSRATRT